MSVGTNIRPTLTHIVILVLPSPKILRSSVNRLIFVELDRY